MQYPLYSICGSLPVTRTTQSLHAFEQVYTINKSRTVVVDVFRVLCNTSALCVSLLSGSEVFLTLAINTAVLCLAPHYLSCQINFCGCCIPMSV